MTILDVLRHQWVQQWRSVTWGRNLIANILLGLAGVYVGVTFLGLGWIYPQVVAEVAPSLDPLHLLNRHLLLAVLAVLVLRFFLQQPAGGDVQSYLALPIPTGRLAGHLQVVSGLSAFTLIPVVTLATFGASTVAPATDLGGTGCWTLGVLLVVVLTQGANTLLRVAWERHAGLVVGGAAVLVVGVAAGNALGVGGLRAASAGLFGGLSAGRLLPLAGLGVATALTMIAAHRALRARLYDVLERGGPAAGPAGAPLTLLRGQWGTRPAVSFALLDAKLILRNRRPRQMMIVNLSAWIMFGLILVEGDISPFNQVLFGFILSGYLALGYFQYGHAWHGMHFDGVLTRSLSPAALVRGQYLTFTGLAAAPVAVMVPVVAWMRPEFLRPVGVFFLFNLGVSAPFLIGVGVWFREALHLNESAFFNYQGTSSLHVLSFVLLMGLPIGLTIGFGKPTALLVGTGLGVLGIATAPLWTRGLGQLLYGQRHAMAAGFRETE